MFPVLSKHRNTKIYFANHRLHALPGAWKAAQDMISRDLDLAFSANSWFCAAYAEIADEFGLGQMDQEPLKDEELLVAEDEIPRDAELRGRYGKRESPGFYLGDMPALVRETDRQLTRAWFTFRAVLLFVDLIVMCARHGATAPLAKAKSAAESAQTVNSALDFLARRFSDPLGPLRITTGWEHLLDAPRAASNPTDNMPVTEDHA